MNKIFGWLTAILVAGALAMPASAAPPQKPGGGGGGGGHTAGGGGHAAPARATGGGGGRSIGGGGGGGGRSAFHAFTSHGGGRSVNSGAVNRGTPINRSVQRTQNLRLQNLQQASPRQLRREQRALRRQRDHAAGGAARPLRRARARSRGKLRCAPGLAARPARRLCGVVRAGVLALRLFRHFRLRVLARRL